MAEDIRVDMYMAELSDKDCQHIYARNTTKVKLFADYLIRRVYVWDKENSLMLRCLLGIRRSKTPKGSYEYKYSFTNAKLEKYTEKDSAYMQAQSFFVEHFIKENKHVLQ
ncbi:MAG: hypothetical protein ACK5HT_12300 [Draconibacterium sp.]